MAGRKSTTVKRFPTSCRFTWSKNDRRYAAANRSVDSRTQRAGPGLARRCWHEFRFILLDTNIPENVETDRWVTGHLYGGDRETRIVQEMLLGIGGVRLLRKLGISPHVFHLNEGHSAFLTLELAREVVQTERQPFPAAVETGETAMRFYNAHTGGGRQR